MNTDNFLNSKNKFAVIGVSTNPNKWGWKIFNQLKLLNFIVYAINPNHKKIGADVCWPNLMSLPEKPSVVITVVPPKVTEEIVKECKNLGINKIWMQPGSESKKAINYCKNNNIKTISNACFVVNGLKKKFGGL